MSNLSGNHNPLCESVVWPNGKVKCNCHVAEIERLMEIKIRQPTSRGGYCYHCDTRQCIYPACEDINKAREQGATEGQIIAALKDRAAQETDQ